MSKEIDLGKIDGRYDTVFIPIEMWEDISKKLKALKIIKEKRVFIEELLQSDDLEEYNDYVEEQGRYDEDKLTQEEFDMLKEVLL